jgi:SAM-dependent methyltransferase
LSDGAVNTDLVGSFQEIVQRIVEAELPGLAQFPMVRANAEPAAARQFVQHKLDLSSFGGIEPHGRVFLDAGCGFGFTLLVYGLAGATQLRGLEVQQDRVETIHKYASLLPSELAERLDVRQGDVAQMPWEDGSADVVLANEAISHFHDTPDFLSEARRVLRTGGLLLIADGNNARNPLIRRHTHRFWEAFEQGPVGLDLNGHVVGRAYGPFVDVRRDILADAFPDLPEEKRNAIARGTFGFTQADVVHAGRQYLETNALPGSFYRTGRLPRDPISGQVMERLFDPYKLAREIEGHGFRVRVAGYWGGAAGNPAVRVTNLLLQRFSRLTMFSARGFRIVARRL